MKRLERIQPTGAWHDVRYFFGRLGQPHQLGFLLLSITITAVTLWVVYKDSYFEKEYKREIVYVQQWKADRTDAEIIAQQKIDAPEKARREAEEQRILEENRQKFKRIDDNLKKWGI